MKPVLSILNGSLQESKGNTAKLIDAFVEVSNRCFEIAHLDLRAETSLLEQSISSSNAFLFATGTYWDNWGSPLQCFLERMTHTEGSSIWLGKPAAVIVSMHSVGGKEVASRLQGVLNTFGLLLPPMTSFVYSAASHVALAEGSPDVTDDLWSLEDLEIVSHNLFQAASLKLSWRSWSVDQDYTDSIWFK